MTAGSLKSGSGMRTVADTAAQARKHLLRSRMVVAGSSVREVVESAGGWLFDQVAAGWDITVIVEDRSDTRPLEILGVTPLDFDSALCSTVRAPLPRDVAVSAELAERNDRVRRGLLALMAGGEGLGVTVWGAPVPPYLDGLVPTEHILSVAARAFKGQAQAAAGSSAPVSAGESFYGLEAQPSAKDSTLRW